MASNSSEHAERRGRGALAWGLLAAIGLGGLALQAWLAPDPQVVSAPEARPLVDVASYVRSSEPLRLQRVGRIHPRHEATLAAEIPGRITAIHPELRVGARLPAGAVLVRLDQRPLLIRRDELEAEQVARHAERRQLESRLGRLRDLAERDFVGQDTLDELESSVVAATAAADRIAAQLAAVALDIERSEIRTPFAADIVEVMAAPGVIAQPGQPLLRLLAADEAELRIALTPPEVPWVQLALADERLHAELVGSTASLSHPRLASAVDPGSRTVLLAFRLSGADDYRLGELVDVRLELDLPGEHYALPRGAEQRLAGRVWRIDGEDRLQAAEVEPLLYSDDRVYVRSDDLGDAGRVLLTPLPTATAGMAVQVVESGE